MKDRASEIEQLRSEMDDEFERINNSLAALACAWDELTELLGPLFPTTPERLAVEADQETNDV